MTLFKVFTRKKEKKPKSLSEKRIQLINQLTEQTNSMSIEDIQRASKKNPTIPFFQNIINKEEFKARNIIAAFAALAGGGNIPNSESSREIIKYATEGLRINPESAYLLQMRGRSYGDVDRFEDGLLDLDKAIKIQPQYADAYLERGHIKQKLGHQRFANEDYAKAKKINPKIVLPAGNHYL